MDFDSIDLLSRKPQLGNGNVLVRCSNASSKLLKLSLIADMSSDKAPNGEWALLQNGSNAMDLKIFVDPQLQQSLGTTGIPNAFVDTHTMDRWKFKDNGLDAIFYPGRIQAPSRRPAQVASRQLTDAPK